MIITYLTFRVMKITYKSQAKEIESKCNSIIKETKWFAEHAKCGYYTDLQYVLNALRELDKFLKS